MISDKPPHIINGCCQGTYSTFSH